MTLELGGKTVELYYPGRAHSDNDLILVYPARRVAFVSQTRSLIVMSLSMLAPPLLFT